MKTILEAKNISKTFGAIKVLNKVNLSIKEGEIISIVGPSGAGKTTLLQILGTLLNHDKIKESSLTINSIKISGLINNKLAELRNNHLGFIFQFHELLPEFTALENVMLPSLINGLSINNSQIKAKKLLCELGLENKFNNYSNELSGGEQQRVSVARALINNPKIIFADEPSGNLDTKNASDLHNLFFKLRNEIGQTFIIVTHNQDLANKTDRKIKLLDGNIIS